MNRSLRSREIALRAGSASDNQIAFGLQLCYIDNGINGNEVLPK